MLLSPSFAFAKTVQEIWIEQVYQVYPCRRPSKTRSNKTTPRHQSIQRLRAMQGQTVFGYVRDQVLNLVEVFVPPSRTLVNG